MLVLEFKSSQDRGVVSILFGALGFFVFQYVFSDLKKPYLNCCLFLAREFLRIESMAFFILLEKSREEMENRQTNGKESAEK